MSARLRELRKRWWLTQRLHRDYPADGYLEAWRTAGLLRRIRLEPLMGRPLTEQERFETEAELGLADIPVVERVG